MKASAKWQAVYDAAEAAGQKAAAAKVPVPMIVGTPVDTVGSMMGGDGGGFRTDRPVYYVAGGVCGFAAVTFPGTSGFAKWAKAAGHAHKHYPTGYAISAGMTGGQSLEIKEAWARAFSEVLREAGIPAYTWSRMD
jgi:hypothetical protein